MNIQLFAAPEQVRILYRVFVVIPVYNAAGDLPDCKSHSGEGSRNPNPMKIVLVIPLFDDWESAALICGLVDRTFLEYGSHDVTIVFVDDGSFTSDEALHKRHLWDAIHEIHVLRLRRNVGHQRAIAIGLAYVEHHVPCDVVVVMDGDGEDRPQDIPALLARATGTPSGQVVFAERGRRVEGTAFRLLYLAYRGAHRLLTGRGIRFGNFSVIPFCFIRRLTTMSELWGHYAAAVVNARIPYTMVRLDRGRRLVGTTKMNLESLILHGLSAMAVYQTVSVRALIGGAALSGLLLLLVLALTIIRLTTSLPISGRTAIMLGICSTIICLITFSTVIYVFTALSFRHLMGMLPTRDYIHFVDRCDRVYPV
jgi:polyisoprenyl-phosphate glycosyltransferase